MFEAYCFDSEPETDSVPAKRAAATVSKRGKARRARPRASAPACDLRALLNSARKQRAEDFAALRARVFALKAAPLRADAMTLPWRALALEEHFLHFNGALACFFNHTHQQLYVHLKPKTINFTEIEDEAAFRDIKCLEKLCFLQLNQSRFFCFDAAHAFVKDFERASFRGQNYLADETEIEGHIGVINDVCCDPETEQFIFTASDDHTCRLFSLDDIHVKGVGLSLASVQTFKSSGAKFRRLAVLRGQAPHSRVLVATAQNGCHVFLVRSLFACERQLARPAFSFATPEPVDDLLFTGAPRALCLAHDRVLLVGEDAALLRETKLAQRPLLGRFIESPFGVCVLLPSRELQFVSESAELAHRLDLAPFLGADDVVHALKFDGERIFAYCDKRTVLIYHQEPDAARFREVFSLIDEISRKQAVVCEADRPEAFGELLREVGDGEYLVKDPSRRLQKEEHVVYEKNSAGAPAP